MISHVDDLLWSGSKCFKSNIIEMIRTVFQIREENSSAFTYVGIEIFQDLKGIYLCQKKYITELEEIVIDPSRKDKKELPLNAEEKTLLRKAIGQLNWLATQTRPELSFAVSELSSSVKNSTIRQLVNANKLIRSVKSSDVHIFFPKLNLDSVKIRVYTDASFGKIKDGASQGGMFVELSDGEASAPIGWQSKRITRVVSDVMAAETLAAVAGLDAGYLISTLFSELIYNNQKKVMVELMTDSNSLFEAAHSIKSVKNRRLRIDLSIIREYIINNEVQVNWVPSEHQLADVLTKEGVDRMKLTNHITA